VFIELGPWVTPGVLHVRYLLCVFRLFAGCKLSIHGFVLLFSNPKKDFAGEYLVFHVLYVNLEPYQKSILFWFVSPSHPMK
jgi:hypothetical protein